MLHHQAPADLLGGHSHPAVGLDLGGPGLGVSVGRLAGGGIIDQLVGQILLAADLGHLLIQLVHLGGQFLHAGLVGGLDLFQDLGLPGLDLVHALLKHGVFSFQLYSRHFRASFDFSRLKA